MSLTPEELAVRRNTLGSSEIGAVVGVNPYASAHSVWLSKVHGVEFEGNEATELGNWLEPTILEYYSKRYGRQVTKGRYTVGPEPWMSATPDAMIVGGGICEAKLVGFRTIFQWGNGSTDEAESDAVPLHYLTQAYWQMAVTGEPFVDVAALMGTEFRSYRVRYNEAVQSQLVAQGRDFWERYVVTATPPPIDGSDGAREMLRRLYPRSHGEPIPATEHLHNLVQYLVSAREDFDRAKVQKQLRENQIKAELRDVCGAIGNGWRIRYATTKSGTRPFVLETDKDREQAA